MSPSAVKDEQVMQIANEFLAVMRKHTETASDRQLVRSAIGIARNLWELSAPSFTDDLTEPLESLQAS